MRILISMIVAALLATSATPALAEASVKCELKFKMSGWSAFYKQMSGTGTISCSNGQSMAVKIKSTGGGLTAGKSSIDDGHGEFSSAASINELLGKYVSAEAHAGAVKSSKAQVVTKGEITLALSGTGRGWDLGVAFGNFVISRR